VGDAILQSCPVTNAPLVPASLSIRNVPGILIHGPAGQLSGTLNTTALPSGVNWPQTSMLTLDGATLAIDPLNNRVGIGTVSLGLTLQQEGVMEGDRRVALTGRVLVQADASAGPIKPGDLLTTSPILDRGVSLLVRPANYNEVLTISNPMTLRAPRTGWATVGRPCKRSS
jgi:hypothetical protein